MNPWLAFVLGAMVLGVPAGFFVAALCQAAGQMNDDLDQTDAHLGYDTYAARVMNHNKEQAR